MAEAIFSVSEEMGLPVILSVAEVHFRYLNLAHFAKYLKQRIEAMTTPVALHLDHSISSKRQGSMPWRWLSEQFMGPTRENLS